MIGEQIGNFRIVSQLGQGGMGEVYLGEHEKIGTRVAVKLLQPHISMNKDHVERFFNEAIAVSKIQHSGIGKIFDVGFHAHGRAYLVMEFLAGETLATRIRRLGKLPLGQVCELGRQICGVLEAVHKAGITHRDLKPDNIFVVPDDELPSGERVKIVDFGIAKLSGAGGGLTATGSGSMGTPAYMSPEQWKNSKTVDWRADAYSLGCLTFEMVAGRPPFIAETIGEACSLHLTEEAPRLGSMVAAPAPLDALVASLLAKSPDQRPASMRDIANAFAALAGDPSALGAAEMPAPAIALGATLPSTPPVPANMATQATVVPQAAPPPPPPLNTTLGGAASSAAVPVKQPNKGLIWALVGVVALLVVAVIVLFVRDRSTAVDPAVSVQVYDVPTPDDKPTKPARVEAGSGSGGSGSGSSAVDVTNAVATNAGSAVGEMLRRNSAGSGSAKATNNRRHVRSLEAQRAPEVDNGSAGPAPLRMPDQRSAPDVTVTSNHGVIRGLLPRIKECGVRQGAPKGTQLTISATIGTAGIPISVAVETEVPGLGACVRAIVRMTQFPRPPKDTPIREPIVL